MWVSTFSPVSAAPHERSQNISLEIALWWGLLWARTASFVLQPDPARGRAHRGGLALRHPLIRTTYSNHVVEPLRAPVDVLLRREVEAHRLHARHLSRVTAVLLVGDRMVRVSLQRLLRAGIGADSAHSPDAGRPDDKDGRGAADRAVDRVPVHAGKEAVLQPVLILDGVVDLHERIDVRGVPSVLREVVAVGSVGGGLIEEEAEEDSVDDRPVPVVRQRHQVPLAELELLVGALVVFVVGPTVVLLGRGQRAVGVHLFHVVLVPLILHPRSLPSAAADLLLPRPQVLAHHRHGGHAAVFQPSSRT